MKLKEFTPEQISQTLISHGIKPTYQRIKVYGYLLEHKCHPTVDIIYNGMKKEIPTLSKSTVYNALDAFVRAKLVNVLRIEDNETRYDIIVMPHGHFKCDVCGKIYNFQIDVNAFNAEGLEGFEITEKNVHFNGICPDCRQKENNIRKE